MQNVRAWFAWYWMLHLARRMVMVVAAMTRMRAVARRARAGRGGCSMTGSWAPIPQVEV